MTRYLSVLIVLVCLTAVSMPARAGESHNSDIGFSSSLVKRSFRVGQVGVELFAQDRVDAVSLLADVDFSKAATPQSISDQVNARRKQLYPDAEIILSLTPAQTPGSGPGDKAGLVKAIYWWNNTNCSTCYWYAQYTSTAATMFIDDVQYGAYNVYDRTGSGNWVFRYLVNAGGAATRATYGSSGLKGFKGSAAGVSSKADVVMYFFN